MKGIVKIYNRSLMAPSVAAASKLAVMLGACKPVLSRYNGEQHHIEYVLSDPEDCGGNMDVEMNIVRDEQVRSRVPKSRRIEAGAGGDRP
jgi:hypothetical protein